MRYNGDYREAMCCSNREVVIAGEEVTPDRGSSTAGKADSPTGK